MIDKTNTAREILKDTKTDLPTALATHGEMMEFRSLPLDIITISGAASNYALNDVVVADIPAGKTVRRCLATLSIDSITDTSGAPNYISVVGNGIQINDGVTAINLTNNLFYVTANETRTGAEVKGSIDLGSNGVSVVTGNATFTFRFSSIDSSADDLELRHLTMILQVWLEG